MVSATFTGGHLRPVNCNSSPTMNGGAEISYDFGTITMQGVHNGHDVQ